MHTKLLPSLALITSLLLSQHNLALTFKTGEVIGPDGLSYAGMSPQNKARLLAANVNGIKSGVINKHFYLVYNNQVVTVPVKSLRNKTSDQRMGLIKQAISHQSAAQLTNASLAATNKELDRNNHDLDHKVQELGDHLEGLEDGIESSLEHDLRDELEHSLEHDLKEELEHKLHSELDETLEHEINGHLEQDHIYDAVDHVESEHHDGHDEDDDNHDSDRDHDDGDSHDDDDSHDDHDD